MTPELQSALKRHMQWFGSYKKSGELVKVQVWLIVSKGRIEFLTNKNSYKLARLSSRERALERFQKEKARTLDETLPAPWGVTSSVSQQVKPAVGIWSETTIFQQLHRLSLISITHLSCKRFATSLFARGNTFQLPSSLVDPNAIRNTIRR